MHFECPLFYNHHTLHDINDMATQQMSPRLNYFPRPEQVFQHVPIQPRDAREASDVFYKQKTGDALLTYENEVIMTNMSQAAERRLPYVVPQNNVSVHRPQHLFHPLAHFKLSACYKACWSGRLPLPHFITTQPMPSLRLQVEFPIALIDRNLDKQPPEARTAAEAFIHYCFTPEAQREFASCGFRYPTCCPAASSTTCACCIVLPCCFCTARLNGGHYPQQASVP